MLISFLPPGWPVVVGIEETVERRPGRKSKAKGRYREAVRSTDKTVVTGDGLKWLRLRGRVPIRARLSTKSLNGNEPIEW